MNGTILDYIPQRPPFTMVSEVISADDTRVHTQFLVKGDNILLEDGYLAAAALVENMAQAAAAGMGYLNRDAQGEPAIGYIGAVKNLYVHQLPAVGDVLDTEIVFQHQVLNARIVQGKVSVNGTEVAGCELKIFINSPA